MARLETCRKDLIRFPACVRTLDVTVKHLLCVAVSQTLEQLLHVAFDLRHRELLASVDEAGQVVLKKLHDHVNGPLALIVVRGWRGRVAEVNFAR